MPTTVTPDILSNTPSYFNSGASYATGTYIVTYTSGAMKYSPATNWFCNAYRIIDDSSNITLGPCYGVLTAYANQAACEAANAGTFVTYTQTVTGKIGLFFTDSFYGDNVAGSPSPTFQLEAFTLSSVGNCQSTNTLTVSAIAAATAYTFYRSTTSGSGYALVQTGSSTTFTDSLTPAGVYYYVVTVTTSTGTSGYSNEVKVNVSNRTIPDALTGVVANFAAGANLTAGRYRVAYLVGAYKLNPNAPFGVQYNDNDAQIDGSHGFYITDGASNVVRGPGLRTGYQTQAQTETGNSGQYLYYDHVGGLPIGMYLLDGYYPDNVAGAPNPTFSLCGPLVATLTASALSIDVGDSSTLTWASTNADSATDPLGGTTTSGSQAVSPTTSTTYTFDATGFAGNIEKAVTVTIVVNPPTAPTGTSAVGSCGGTVALSWSGATHTSSYILERSADGSTGWSQIAAQAGTTYTDTPPSPGVLFYYRVKSVKGSATSAASATFSASTILAAPTPAFTLTAKGTSATVSWTVPIGAYGNLTTTIFRVDPVSLVETAIVANLPVASGQYTITGLSAGVRYFYRVGFVNDCGSGTEAIAQTIVPVCCQNDWAASAAPANSSTASAAPVSTFTASAASVSNAVASTAPSTSFTASPVPSTRFTPGGCPG